MTYNEAKNELETIRYKYKKMDYYLRKINRLRELAKGNGSMKISNTPGILSFPKKEMKDFVALTLDLEREYNEFYINCEAEFIKIQFKIDKLSDKDATIISMHFIDNNSYEEMAELLGYSKENIRKLVYKAIKNYANIS